MTWPAVVGWIVIAFGLMVRGPFLAALRKDGCLILDARMPQMDGFEVLRRLAAGGAHPPVIMITGQGDVQTAVRAMKGERSTLSKSPSSPIGCSPASTARSPPPRTPTKTLRAAAPRRASSRGSPSGSARCLISSSPAMRIRSSPTSWASASEQSKAIAPRS
jgi:DNA-binding NtrC family response regulator